MARGAPALWSTLVAGGTAWSGVYLDGHGLPVEVRNAALVLACVVAVVGVHVHRTAPEPPSFDDTELLDTRHPAQVFALVRVGLGLPLLVTGLVLLYETSVPVFWPLLAAAVGGYLLVWGIKTYWRNTLTTYYLTTDGIVESYRLLSSHRRSLPFEKARVADLHRRWYESPFEVGTVVVRTGGGDGLTVRTNHVTDPESFHAAVERRLKEVHDEAGTTGGRR